jgi:hypothetical protein
MLNKFYTLEREYFLNNYKSLILEYKDDCIKITLNDTQVDLFYYGSRLAYHFIHI